MIQTILVALDCSETSEQVIEALTTLKIDAKAKIILSHVLPSLSPDSDLVGDRPHQSRESMYQIAEQQLQNYQSQLTVNSTLEIVSGDPSEEIIRLANIYQADLIIIGTRGLTGVKRVIEGSVSSLVVSDAPCSVLVVKPASR